MRTLRLALAQVNSIVGDLEENFRKIVHYVEQAVTCDADIIAFPELSLTGYPAEDLLLRPEFIDDNLECLRKLIPYSKHITILVGFVDRRDDIFNAAALLHKGALADIYHKQFLPNYSVFDENRYFQEGKRLPIYKLNGINIGVNICEDIWYPGGPTRHQSLYGNAEIIINISASPYAIEKVFSRNKMLSVRARDNEVIVAYVNLIGGQDDLVFDGNSLILSEDGEVIAKAPAFEEALVVADLHPDNVFSKRLHDPRRRKEKLFVPANMEIQQIQLESLEKKTKQKIPAAMIAGDLERVEEVYNALKLGVRDYTYKNHFSKVVLGLSGGVDSALVCALAADALGSKNVTAVSMPGKFTSQSSKDDARQLAENLKVNFREISIDTLYNAYLSELTPFFEGKSPDLTEENIQARIRGNILMALSNKFSWLVLTTGNKSEFSTGYCTLYGDMAGGFAVIKDVPKLLVYELCRYRNKIAGYDLIPDSILTKAPSAELKPGQKDSDSLPPYDILDPVLEAYVERDLAFEEIVSQGFDAEVVKKVIRLVDLNEYKRRQGAPGIKITQRAFGKDRRFPITNGYRHGR
jgi:NAD+ synthase (glutamine-hydrolysing)